MHMLLPHCYDLTMAPTFNNHLEKCSIITKTYQLCHIINFNGPTKSKLHRYLNFMMGNDSKWNVDALNNVWIQSYNAQRKTNRWIAIAFHATNTMVMINYKFVERPKWPNSLWTCHTWPSHCSRWNNTCTFPSLHTYKRELPSYQNLLALCTTQSCSLGVNPTKTSPIYMYVMICASSYMSKAPSSSSSMSTSCELSTPMLV